MTYNIEAGGLGIIMRLTILFLFQIQLRRENARLKARADFFRQKKMDGEALAERLRGRITALRDQKREVMIQNEAACDAKSIMESGLINGESKLEIIKRVHAKLREVTPELIEEDAEDPDARPLMMLSEMRMKDAQTQTG